MLEYKGYIGEVVYDRALRRRGPPARAGLAAARPRARPRGHPRLPAHPHRRARQHRQVPLAHAAAAALTAAAQLRRRARRGAGAPRRGARGAPPGRDHPVAARPAPLRRAARPPLRAGVRPGARAHRLGPRLRGGPARPAGVPATANGTAVTGASPQARVKPLRPPTPRQQELWKAIRQAQLRGLSMRAIARVLGISRNTVRRYVLAGWRAWRGAAGPHGPRGGRRRRRCVSGRGCSLLASNGVRQANWCLGRRCKSSTAKEQATPRSSASRARLVARRAVKRRQRGRWAELLSTEKCIVWSAEAFPLVEGNTGDGASGEPSSGSAVSKNSRTPARPAPGPGRARLCPCVLPRRDRNGKGDPVIR